MQVTTTEFRKNLFQLVERALNGEHIEVVHKGRTVRLIPSERPSKLARLIPRNTTTCDLDDLDKHLRALDDEMRNEAEAKWRSRL